MIEAALVSAPLLSLRSPSTTRPLGPEPSRSSRTGPLRAKRLHVTFRTGAAAHEPDSKPKHRPLLTLPLRSLRNVSFWALSTGAPNP